MGWNGSGTFSRLYSWVADKAAGLDISSTRMDADSDDIASSGFGNCLTRDGQGQPSANLPMNGFRHTGVSNGVARTDYAALNQAQDGLVGWTIASGTSDAITATYTPTRGAPSDGSLYCFRATAANATTTPTFAPDSQSAQTITRFGGAAVQKGDIAGDLAEVILRYNSANTRYELLNPANPVNNAVIGGTGALALPDGTTTQRPTAAAGLIRFNSTTTAFEGNDGTSWRNLNSPDGVGPSVTSYTSGSGTYTTPTGALYLVIEMVGGGGGGGGSGTGSSSGTAGGETSFNSVVAAGGAQGVAGTSLAGQSGGGGGTGGGGGGIARFPGQAGGPGVTSVSISGTALPSPGGAGGSSIFGGAGVPGTPTINAGAAQANTGSGGGGGGATSSPTGGGGGGGGGEYARLIIASPSASYSYTVGTGGGGGSGGGGTNGGAGAAGVIIVTAYFQ